MFRLVYKYLRDITENKSCSVLAYYDEEADDLQYIIYNDPHQDISLFMADEFIMFSDVLADIMNNYVCSHVFYKKITKTEKK